MGRCCTYYSPAISAIGAPIANNNNYNAVPIWSLTSPSAYGPLAGMDSQYSLQFRGWLLTPVGGPGFIGHGWHHKPGTGIDLDWTARECGWESDGGEAWIGRPCVRTIDRKWLGESSRWDSITPPANTSYLGIPQFRPNRQLTGYIKTSVGDKFRLREYKLNDSLMRTYNSALTRQEPMIWGSQLGTSPPTVPYNLPDMWSHGQLASSLANVLAGDDYYVSSANRQSWVYAGNADLFGAPHSWLMAGPQFVCCRTNSFFGLAQSDWYDGQVDHSEWGDNVVDDFLSEVFGYPASLSFGGVTVTLLMTGGQYVEFSSPALALPHVDHNTPYRIGYRFARTEIEVGEVVDPWTSQNCKVYARATYSHHHIPGFSEPEKYNLGGIQFTVRDPGNNIVGSGGSISIYAPATRATATLTYSAPVGMDAYDQYGNLGAGLMRGVTVG